MAKKRMNSAVAEANGGIESIRALKHARNVLLNHDLKQPVLYHLVFMGSQSITVYQAVIKSLIRRIRSRCRLEYFGAYENDEVKGMHAHCFILIETSKKTPFKLLDVNDGEYLHKLAERHGLVNAHGKIQRIHVSKPKNPMHSGQFFARPTKGEKLNNCLDWIEYPMKQRSKDGIPAREKYFNSEFIANKAKRALEMQSYYAPATPTQKIKESAHENSIATSPETILPFGSPADPEGISTQAVVDAGQSAYGSEEAGSESEASTNNERYGSEGASPYHERTEMTPAQRFLAFLYERCVDAEMDTEQVRRYLLCQGVVKTPGQVVWELEDTYGFYGYVDTHQPKPEPALIEWDKVIDRSTDSVLSHRMT